MDPIIRPNLQPQRVSAEWLSIKLEALLAKQDEYKSQGLDDARTYADLQQTIDAFILATFRACASPDYVIDLLPISEDEFVLDGERIDVVGLFYWLETGRLMVGSHTPHQMCLWLRGWASKVSISDMAKDIQQARSYLRSLKLNFGFSM
jgi:hypothetical protein